MNVRLADQALRLRLDHDELQRVLAGENISVAISASGLHWQIVLTASDAFEFFAQNGGIECRIPRDALAGLSTKTPSRDRLIFEVAGSDTPTLSITVDVDIRSGPSRLRSDGQPEAFQIDGRFAR